jgi:hypothetical protein
MAGTELAIYGREPHPPVENLVDEHNRVVTDLETLRVALADTNDQLRLLCGLNVLRKNCIMTATATAGTHAGLDIDDVNPENVETNGIVYVRYNGCVVQIPADDELDTSLTCTGSSTIGQSKKGALWIFADAESSAVCTCEASHPGAASAETTAVGALRWLDANHYQRNPGEIPIAVVTVTEGGSGPFTWGAHSISDETEAFIDLECNPGVVNDIAGLIVTAGASTTWAHGAGGIVLGDGTYVAMTAQTAQPVASNKAAIATGKSGALLFYCLSDGGSEALQISTADATHAAALATACAQVGNPYLACIGYLIVDNASGANFTPGTTAWNTTGVTTTVYTLSEGGGQPRALNAAPITPPALSTAASGLVAGTCVNTW